MGARSNTGSLASGLGKQSRGPKVLGPCTGMEDPKEAPSTALAFVATWGRNHLMEDFPLCTYDFAVKIKIFKTVFNKLWKHFEAVCLIKGMSYYPWNFLKNGLKST